MSPVRVVALVGLALMLAGLAVIRSVDNHAYAWLTGQCFRTPAPMICHHRGANSGHQYDI
jgi:hypothetical protein